MGNHLILIIITLITTTLSGFAQNDGKLEGIAYNMETGLPVNNVDVVVSPGGSGTVTDDNGNFSIPQLEPGIYRVFFTHIGFQDLEKSVRITANQTSSVNINLIPKTEQLKEVVISEQAEDIIKAPYIIESIHELEIQQHPARDIGDYLRNTPNLSGIRKGGAGIDPVVRGFKFKQLNVIVNGAIKIEGGCPNRMDPAVSHIDIDDIKKIEVYKGPFALRYGPNFGGIINLSTNHPFTEKEFSTKIAAATGFESNWNGNKERLGITAGNNRVYLKLSGNHKKYGDYKAGNDVTMNAAFTKYNYTALLGVSPADNHHLTISFDRSYGRNLSFPALPMDERSDDTQISSFEYNGILSGKYIKSIKAKMYNSDVHHIMDNKERPFSDTVVAVSDIKARNTGGRAETQIGIKGHEIFIGVDYENIYKDGQRTKSFIMQPNLPVKIESLWNNARINNTGFFTSWNKNTDKLDLLAAARIDLNNASSGILQSLNMKGETMYSNNNTDSKYTNLSISAGVLAHLLHNLDIGVSIGRGVRSPDMTERFIILLPVGYDRFDYLGNPQLKPENNHEIDIKVEYLTKRACVFNISGFFSYVTDYITGKEVPPSEVKPQTKDVLGVKEFINIDHAYLYGFEFVYQSGLFGNFSLYADVAATYGINPSAVKYLIENGQVVGEEIVKNDPLPEIPPLESNIAFTYRLFNNRLIPEISIRMVAAQKKLSESYYEVETPGIATLNFSLQYNFNDYLKLNGGINNIFNKGYYEHLNRIIIGSNTPYYEPGRIFYVNLIFNI